MTARNVQWSIYITLNITSIRQTASSPSHTYIIPINQHHSINFLLVYHILVYIPTMENRLSPNAYIQDTFSRTTVDSLRGCRFELWSQHIEMYTHYYFHWMRISVARRCECVSGRPKEIPSYIPKEKICLNGKRRRRHAHYMSVFDLYLMNCIAMLCAYLCGSGTSIYTYKVCSI